MKLGESDESPVEDIQDNPVNSFELPVDGEGDKTEDIVLQDIPQTILTRHFNNKMLKPQHGEYFRSILNNVHSMCYLIEDDENVMKVASKKLKSLKNFIKESLKRKWNTTLKSTKKTLPMRVPNCEIVKIESNPLIYLLENVKTFRQIVLGKKRSFKISLKLVFRKLKRILKWQLMKIRWKKLV